MATANWYCLNCDTYGGGPPNHQTPQEHIDETHDGGLARIEEV